MDELKKEVLSPPARDGGVICRVVSDGSRAWVESWGGPERGWETGSADLSTALKADPLSPSARPEPGIPEGFPDPEVGGASLAVPPLWKDLGLTAF